MDTDNLSQGTLNRLKRIQEIKGYDEKNALEFAISCGWLSAEKQAYIAKAMKEDRKRGNSSD